MSLIAVIDFETTGLSPAMGDRATEVTIVLVENGQIVDQFQSLMNAGVRLSSFITQFTGITNAMVTSAPSAARVMSDASRFVGTAPLVAHSAAFDRKFWQAELQRADQSADHTFACTLLVSRRLYPHAPNHQLGVLANLHNLLSAGRAHRALADAQMAAALLGQIQSDLRTRHRVVQPDHAMLMALQRCARPAVPALFLRYAA